ncbi:hypothetical protein Bbelb_290630 [Branchiostoma belcheri]|nr:hypothetical protein Bbelb_290630 [Branchiostoma belcheri]
MTDILETDSVKLKSIRAVRWLSYKEANLALHRTLPAVKETLKTDGEELHDATAKSLAKAIMCYDFLAFNHLMCDVLGTIARLSMGLQQDALSFSSVQPAVESTIATLRAMQVGNGGPKFQDFLNNVTNQDYRGNGMHSALDADIMAALFRSGKCKPYYLTYRTYFVIISFTVLHAV